MSVVAGFRTAVRLHVLIVVVWLGSIVAVLPVQLIVLAATGPARAHLPDGGLDTGERLVGTKPLHTGDLIQIGSTVLRFQDAS